MNDDQKTNEANAVGEPEAGAAPAAPSPPPPASGSAVGVALYYDAAQRFNVFLREEPYPFRRLYAIGQEFIQDSKCWNVINAWIGQGGVYHIICAPHMPGYLADQLRAADKQNTQVEPRHD